MQALVFHLDLSPLEGFHRSARSNLISKVILLRCMADQVSWLREECPLFPKQFRLLFNSIFKVEVFTSVTPFLHKIIVPYDLI